MMIAAGLLVAVAACAAEGKSVAIVEDTKTALTVVRAGGKQEKWGGKDLIYLWKGDQISIAEGGAAVLVFFAGTKQTLPAGKFEITDQGCKALGGTPQPSKALPLEGIAAGAMKQGWSKISDGSGRGAGLVLRGAVRRTPADVSPPPVVPIREELVVTDRPAFRWQVGRPPFKVQLCSASNNYPLWSAESEKPELVFPEKEPSLKRNRKYRWELWSLANRETPELVAESTFGVASEETAIALKEVHPLVGSDSPFRLLLAISSFQAYGAESEALAACEKLLKQLPEDQDVLRLAADLYDRAGRTNEGETAYKKALKLGLDVGKDR